MRKPTKIIKITTLIVNKTFQNSVTSIQRTKKVRYIKINFKLQQRATNDIKQ